jgi:hypothetical protein
MSIARHFLERRLALNARRSLAPDGYVEPTKSALRSMLGQAIVNTVSEGESKARGSLSPDEKGGGRMSGDAYDLFADTPRGRFGDNERAPVRSNSRSDLIDLAMVLHHETSPGQSDRGAVLVSSDGEESAAQWIPKSQCQIELTGAMCSGHRKNGQAARFPVCTLTMPQWQAANKGLV